MKSLAKTEFVLTPARLLRWSWHMVGSLVICYIWLHFPWAKLWWQSCSEPPLFFFFFIYIYIYIGYFGDIGIERWTMAWWECQLAVLKGAYAWFQKVLWLESCLRWIEQQSLYVWFLHGTLDSVQVAELLCCHSL